MRTRIKDLPEVEPRESLYDIDYLITRLSSVNSPNSHIVNDLTEMILCLANEIKQLKDEKNK
jgi:hypothetical protein